MIGKEEERNSGGGAYTGMFQRESRLDELIPQATLRAMMAETGIGVNPPPMPPELFSELESKLMTHADAVLKQRSISYGNPNNALENFDNIAHQAGVAPELVWIILWQKGLQTITKLMRGEEVPGELLEERFADAINYLKLGYALKMRSLMGKGAKV